MTYRIDRLMLIDDNPLDQLLHHRIVERSGLVREILQHTDANEALTALEAGIRPNAILLDIRMPGMDGFEFLDAAAQVAAGALDGVVVLMLTTSLDESDRARAEGYEAVADYLFKPLADAHLTRLAELVEERSSGTGTI